jgi:hypothetical protein
MKKYIKKLSVILLMAVILSAFITNICEAGVTASFKGKGNLITPAKSATKKIINAVLGTIRLVGTAISLGILLVISIKYMVASAGERADIKKYALNYIIGAVVLFASTNILVIIKDFVDKTTAG